MMVFFYFSFSLLNFSFVFNEFKNGLKFFLLHEKLREIKRNEMNKKFFSKFDSCKKNLINIFVLRKN